MEQKHLDYLAQLGPIMQADVNPVHVGWYARKYGSGPDCWLATRDYWDGENWRWGGDNGDIRAVVRETFLPWRGLAEPAISATAIADAMLGDAAGLIKVAPTRQEEAPDA